MDQHPVPQDVTTYQFRLVGSMTLKQFLELAAGIVVGVLIYMAPVYPLLKWPFIFLSVFLGVIFAFLPLQDRPLDAWVMNFIKSIYSPTRYVWKKDPKLPDFFDYKKQANQPTKTAKLTPLQKAQFAEYVQSLPQEKKASEFDAKEQAEIAKINVFLQKTTGQNPLSFKEPVKTVNLEPETIQSPPSIRIRSLEKEEKTQKPQSLPASGRPVVEFAGFFTPSLEVNVNHSPKIKPVSKPITKPAVPKKPVLPKPRPIAKKIIAKPIAASLPIPGIPDIINAVVGMVLDNNAKILPNAIVEIRNKDGMPIRASRTNKLGQFFIATPLPNGEYELEVEAEPFSFAIIKFEAKGEILQPFKIQAVS